MSKDSIVDGIEIEIDRLYNLMFDITADVDDEHYESPEWQVRDILDDAMCKLQDARNWAIEHLPE